MNPDNMADFANRLLSGPRYPECGCSPNDYRSCGCAAEDAYRPDSRSPSDRLREAVALGPDRWKAIADVCDWNLLCKDLEKVLRELDALRRTR